MDLQPLRAQDSSLRTLTHELSSASLALDAALSSSDHREDRVRHVRDALETFQTIERTHPSFTVPREVRRRVASALFELEGGKLELAGSDIRWAGGLFERAAEAYARSVREA